MKRMTTPEGGSLFSEKPINSSNRGTIQELQNNDICFSGINSDTLGAIFKHVTGNLNWTIAFGDYLESTGEYEAQIYWDSMEGKYYATLPIINEDYEYIAHDVELPSEDIQGVLIERHKRN